MPVLHDGWQDRAARDATATTARSQALARLQGTGRFALELEALSQHFGALVALAVGYQKLKTMPEAFCGLFRGENFGRRVVKVGEDS